MEKKPEMGICKHCGQYLEISWLRELDPEHFENAEADYLATRSCRCSEGRAFNEREELREKRERERAARWLYQKNTLLLQEMMKNHRTLGISKNFCEYRKIKLYGAQTTL